MAVITEQMIQSAIDRACDTMSKGEGGPFGALILTPDGQVFVSSNQVLKDHDPTAHAEVTCIRKACSALKSHDLSGCVLYTTCMPCRCVFLPLSGQILKKYIMDVLQKMLRA